MDKDMALASLKSRAVTHSRLATRVSTTPDRSQATSHPLQKTGEQVLRICEYRCFPELKHLQV